MSSKSLYPCPGKLGTYNGLYLPGEKFFYCLSKGEEPIQRFPVAEHGKYIYIYFVTIFYNGQGWGKKTGCGFHSQQLKGGKYHQMAIGTFKKKNNGFCLKEDF
uniref:Uncharacterized protein n=1 Tax=Micrurus carvalhoi TaxID=3147026 RepID=A0A2H6MXF7_9SAUR